jgi:hypothetical protein
MQMLQCSLRDKMELLECTRAHKPCLQRTKTGINFWNARCLNESSHEGELKARQIQTRKGDKQCVLCTFFATLEKRQLLAFIYFVTRVFLLL